MESKWIALSNTSIAIFIAFANYNMIIIALPEIFNSLKFNPTSPDALGYLIWLILGYMVVTSSLVVTFGRISDLKGRAKLYSIGFLVFAISSGLISAITGYGNTAVLEMIILRLFQGVGGGLLMVNSAAVLTDYFPKNELGKALGLNQVAGLVGGVAGLIIGGVLSVIDWRYIFLLDFVVGLVGTVWSIKSLRDIQKPVKQTLDVIGNVLFAVGITLLLISVTYGLLPYGSQQLGWGSPYVISGIILSLVILGAFIAVERKVKNPMFDLSLFKIRDFSVANFSNFIASMARQGILLMMLVLLQGIWLPLHGIPYSQTPFWAGLYLIPNMLGFAALGPVSGILSDKYGSKVLTTLGLFVSALGFFLLSLLPYDFQLWQFFAISFIMGAGMGLFSSPNMADIMASVPIQKRGAASGMRASLQNSASALSVALYFSVVITGMSYTLNSSIDKALASYGVHLSLNLPAAVAIFSALLGYDPLAGIASSLPASIASHIDTPTFFVSAIAPSFMSGFRLMLNISAVLLVVSGILSLARKGVRVGEMGNSVERAQKAEKAPTDGS
ncbi:MFS transporter [Stygiolobus caldivivus]|uniref:MFS transporter n=1 Tax=Stygiolobus caldivivus TaxID=2824673 RepID=A0A8D5U7J3_9CREN|nr:MFS transporter [Stygiolobus caldivivus]BCU70266.1 MFS transporter [Stygiolobus caldivivus]